MSAIKVALIGCGGFVYHTHLANILANEHFHIHATVDINIEAAQDIAQKAGAAYWTNDAGRALNDPEVELVFIATTAPYPCRSFDPGRSGRQTHLL